MRIIEINETTKKNIMEDLLKRSPGQYEEYADKVNKIVNDVRKDGDKALFLYTKSSIILI